MLAPITGTPHLEITYRLNNNAFKEALNMPSWFNFSSTGTTISKLFNCLFSPVDEVYSFVDISRNSISTALLEEPRLCYISKIPENLYDESLLSVNKDLQLYYKVSLTGDWVSIYPCKNILEFYISEGPCSIQDRNFTIFRNLNKTLSYITSSTLDSNLDYEYNLSAVLPDTYILYSEDPLTPPNLWGISKYSDLIDNKLYLPSSGYYFYYAQTITGSIFIQWKSNQVTGYSEVIEADLRNSWDKEALKYGLVRKRNENNSSLRKRILTSIYNPQNFTRVNTAINIGRELGTTEYYNWDSSASLNLQTSGHVYIYGVPEKEWNIESLKPVQSNNQTFFTRSKKEVDFNLLYSNNVKISQVTDSEGVITINDFNSNYENYFEIQDSYICKNWEVSGNYLVPSINLAEDTYIVLLENKITLTALTDLRYRNKIKNGYKLTDLALSILHEHKSKIPVYYSKSKWGFNRFLSVESVRSKPTVIPNRFED